MNKKSNYLESSNSRSTRRKRVVLESCIIKLIRLCSILYSNNLINPFPEKIDEIDPYGLIDCLNKLKLSLQDVHEDLFKAESSCLHESRDKSPDKIKV